MSGVSEGHDKDVGSRDSLIRAADKLVLSTRALLKTAKTEEDLRIGFEKILSPLASSLGVSSHPRYERSVLSGGRSDAVHGQVIIEYEKPKSFRSNKRVRHAYEQLLEYIEGEAKKRRTVPFVFDPKFVGIGFDGEEMFFVRYRGDKSKPKTRLNKKDFVLLGPYRLDQQSARTFLTYLRALSRRLLTAEELAEVFGPDGSIAPQSVSAFADALENWASVPRVRTFYNEWRRLFGIVYGEQFTMHQAKEPAKLASLYKVTTDTDFQELLFCVHTYFVLLMKLIVAELMTAPETSLGSSFSYGLAHRDKDKLLEGLHDIEEGGIYAKRGITNFLEGDFFRWYLDAFSPRVEESIREIARSFGEFEPATASITHEGQRDLLKKLYQYLVPGEVRHNLGEYYTPDWLAELVIREVGYNGNTNHKVVDPACGSGTFLVLAIQKAREYAEANNEDPRETAKRITANIWGFDLNPLAVIAARTNYILAMGDLVSRIPHMEIPIYLADSVLWPQRGGQLRLNFAGGDHVRISTSVGDFHVPAIWVQDRGFLMKQAAPLLEQMVKDNYSPSEALRRMRKKGLVFAPNERIVQNFYEEILSLEKDGKNGIWARFLKNAFAPMIAEGFDFVIGNPPWIRWGYLSQEYREATLGMWRDYGLFSLKGHAARLGGGEKDFSMLFTYAAIDYYLKDKGKLGFLITQEVFKSKGAGEGFRRFRLGEREELKVMKAADLVTVHPFEGAANKTAMIVVKKGVRTTYPVTYTEWVRNKGVGKIPTDYRLNEALPLLSRRRLRAYPMGKRTGSWQTVSPRQSNLLGLKGENPYTARLGARVEPYGVFWLEIEELSSGGNVMVRNLAERGKRKVPTVRETIEQDLVFPAVTGGDVGRWSAVPSVYVLMSQDPATSKPYPEPIMKRRWPRTYSYLTRFKDVLLTRGSRVVRELAERTAFYAMYGIGPYTVANFKVVWKRMASDIVAAVISQHKTPFGYKTVIPTDTTSLFPTNTEREAHYLCAILNSSPVREFIKTYSSSGRGFGAPSVMNPIGIPQFDSKNPQHRKLCDLSKSLHEVAAAGEVSAVSDLEKQVDKMVNKLFAIRPKHPGRPKK